MCVVCSFYERGSGEKKKVGSGGGGLINQTQAQIALVDSKTLFSTPIDFYLRLYPHFYTHIPIFISIKYFFLKRFFFFVLENKNTSQVLNRAE